MRRWASALLALAALLAPAVARADGDPASDYLLTQPIFTPIDVKIPEDSVRQLETIQKEAKDEGYEVRVALIATRYDLGAVPVLYNKPTAYLALLSQEVRFVYKGPILVVMPAGYAYYEQGKGVTKLDLPKPSEAPDLARAAVPAVQLLAERHGIDVEIPTLGGGGGDVWRDRALIAAGAVVLAALLAGALWLRRRPRTRS
jgi:hypothetical protein